MDEPMTLGPARSTCSRCGGPLPAGGACPRCLIGLGLDPVGRDPDARLDEPARASTGAPNSARRAPPPIPELAKAFPTLDIVELLGHGGMGFVYRAKQKDLDRDVALKILAPELGEDPAFVERFLREARALARLSHPNIVAVHDFGRSAGLCWLVMEYVDGVNLRTLLREKTLTPEKALTLVPPMCDALQCAHDLGIVHRDVKPENVLVDRRGVVKLVDFGLAKLAGDAADANLTRAEQVMGTPQYMAPEQMRASHDVDHRADIYSLGVVVYEMLTGALPVGNYALPSRRVAVDVRIDDVVLRAMEHEPARRYQHAVEVKTDVQEAGRSAGGAPPPRENVAPETSSANGDALGWVAAVGALLLVNATFSLLRVALVHFMKNASERNGWIAVACACSAGGAWLGMTARRRLRIDVRGTSVFDDLDRREPDVAAFAVFALGLVLLLLAGFGTQDRYATEVAWMLGALQTLMGIAFGSSRAIRRSRRRAT